MQTSVLQVIIDDIELEVNKAKLAQEYGADALMDLSTGSDLTTFRKKIMDAVDITIGTVPYLRSWSNYT